MYEDRTAAGRILGEQLVSQDVDPDVVLAVPPGGINVAQPICERFDADLGLIASEPIRTPSTEDPPVGAVADTGVAWIDDDLVEAFGVDQEKLDAEKQRAFREARNKHEAYGDVVDDPTPSGTVAIVDEGLLSTMRMKANVSAIGQAEDSSAVAVAPISVAENTAELHALADDVVVDATAQHSRILDDFYDNFDRPAVPQSPSN